MDFKDEIWKDVIGWEGFYIVSNYGRVKWIYGDNHFIIDHVNYSPFYLMFRLAWKGREEIRSVHTLVAMAFLGHKPMNRKLVDPYKRIVVDHIDGDILNNHVSNLQLLTNLQNIKKGLIDRGAIYSQYSGVTWQKTPKKWMASKYKKEDKKTFVIGLFKTEQEAIDALLKYHVDNGLTTEHLKVDLNFKTKKDVEQERINQTKVHTV